MRNDYIVNLVALKPYVMTESSRRLNGGLMLWHSAESAAVSVAVQPGSTFSVITHFKPQYSQSYSTAIVVKLYFR